MDGFRCRPYPETHSLFVPLSIIIKMNFVEVFTTFHGENCSFSNKWSSSLLSGAAKASPKVRKKERRKIVRTPTDLSDGEKVKSVEKDLISTVV